MNDFKYSFTYDGNNNLTEWLMQDWDGSAWVNDSKYSYTYDGNNNQTEELFQFWDGSAWVNQWKYSFTYDGNNNLTEGLLQTWAGSVWVNQWKYSNTYDGNNNLVEQLYQTWDGSNWLNVNKYIYSYIPTGIEQFEGEVSTYSLSNNYPNPFNPLTTIKYQIPELSIVTLKVFDILGNEIETLVNEEKSIGKYEIEFDASRFSSGVYFYQLRSGEFISTKKMILLK